MKIFPKKNQRRNLNMMKKNLNKILLIIPKIPKGKQILYQLCNMLLFKKWYIRINIVINQDYVIKNATAFIDSGANMNCIQEGLVTTK